MRYLEIRVVWERFVPQVWSKECSLRLDIPWIAVFFVFVLVAADVFTVAGSFS